jgi:hypothetical protein
VRPHRVKRAADRQARRLERAGLQGGGLHPVQGVQVAADDAALRRWVVRSSPGGAILIIRDWESFTSILARAICVV